MPSQGKRRIARRASAVLVALGGALIFAVVMGGRMHPDGTPAPSVAVAMKPRVRVWLDEPTFTSPRPEPMKARDPRNAFEMALAPYDRWTHPIPDDRRWLPVHDSMRFGARRPHRAPGCGRGHCGVDLAALRSTPVVSIGDGIVERVEKDRRVRSGLYVTVAHDDGKVISQYMHLDQIRDDLQPGVKVRAGEWLGSLGRTGVRESDPHLHFGVVVRFSKKKQRPVDPEPMLRRAQVIALLDMTVLP